MSDRVGCGSHENDAPLPNGFDYTCEDCMIPDSLDPPEFGDDQAYDKIDEDEADSPNLSARRPF